MKLSSSLSVFATRYLTCLGFGRHLLLLIFIYRRKRIELRLNPCSMLWWFLFLNGWFSGSIDSLTEINPSFFLGYLDLQAINDNDIHSIVLSYLIHNCYKESVESFITSTGTKQPADYLEDMDKRKSRFMYTKYFQDFFFVFSGYILFACLS